MSPCVLIIDDSLTVRMDLKEAFDAAGFETLTSATLEAAREICRQREFDLAILDVLLPDGDGLSLLQELKATPATANRPVLLLSTEDEVRDRVRGLKTGADDYVGKPYDAVQVVARARDLVRRKQGGRRERPLVVLVDDSPTFANELREALEAAGYEVSTGGSGEEGLRLAAAMRPDAVICDQELPGIDGPEMLRQLRADAALRRTPCLLLTASEKKADEVRALEAGADSFSLKHAGAPVILAKLAALLRVPRESAPAATLASLLAPKRILAVDDSAEFLDELCDRLQGEGYDMVAAHSGEEALELLSMQPVDGLLLDLMMPGMSGQETCRRIKASPAWRDIPLIIITALGENEAMIESINAGADDYIVKSGDFEILKARLRAQLRRKQFEDENRTIRDQVHRREMEAVEVEALRELSATRATHIADLEQKNAQLARTNDELRRTKDAVENANQELESFSYSVSHDLRAPLRAIDGFSQILMDQAGPKLDPVSHRSLERVRAATQRMSQLIDDMLNLARVTRQHIQREKVDLSAEAEKIIGVLRAAAPAEREVDVRIAPGLIVNGDRGLLCILLENLLGNAWKFTSKREHARIEVGRQRTAEGADAYYIRDNGAGFDMAYAEKLFGAFQRLHSTDEFPGTGVGLATVARVIRRHGGKVWAESIVDQGATFFFTLAPT